MIFQRNQKGFALAFAILLVVALQASIANVIFSMMRHQREIARVSHRTQVAWAREAVIDRAIKLFADYVAEKNAFPGTDASNLVLGSDALFTGGLTFSQYLVSTWYPGLKSRFPDPLNQIQLSSVEIKEFAIVSADERQYEIKISAQHAITQVTGETTQRISIKKNPFLFARQNWSEGASL